MFKLLFRYVIPLVVMLTIGIVGYNYFFGNAEEKANSEKIISRVAGLGNDVYDLLVSEKQKFDAGKYDDAISKIGSGIAKLKEQASSLVVGGQQFLESLNQLEQEKQQLEEQLALLRDSESDAVNRTEDPNAEKSVSARSSEMMSAQQIEDRIKELARRTEELGSQMGG